MYLTKYNVKDKFDWDSFFDVERSEQCLKEKLKPVMRESRKHLKIDVIKFTMEMNRLIKELTKSLIEKNIHILELGAGTGFLTRCLLHIYGGYGTLVDSNPVVYKRYCEMQDTTKCCITYKKEDVFNYEDEQRYDIVCSFGLIEHFCDKTDIINAHRKYLASDGYCIILVPMDSSLTRVYYELYPELNQGYRELLSETELRAMINSNGLKIIRTLKSQYLSYDILSVICKKKDVGTST